MGTIVLGFTILIVVTFIFNCVAGFVKEINTRKNLEQKLRANGALCLISDSGMIIQD